jgi:DNA-binding NarL/FixJ family response regulator
VDQIDAMRFREDQLKAMKVDRHNSGAPLKVRGDLTAIIAADFATPLAGSANDNRAKSLTAVEWAVTHPGATEAVSLLPARRIKSGLAATQASLDMLSCRQREVLDLIVQGMSNKEIARALNVAVGTVKIHVAALFAKLGVHRRAAIAVMAARLLAGHCTSSAR